MKDYKNLLTALEVNLESHERLEESLRRAHEQYFLWQAARPQLMARFDASCHESHGARVAEIFEHRQKGGKSIGTFCIYVPDEIAIAACVIPIPLCGGSAWAITHADKILPRDICPLIRSTFGMSISGTCPYKKLKDFAVGETTCDAKKKAWDLFGFKVLEVPQKKKSADASVWFAEVIEFKTMMEELSGVSITPLKLAESIRLMNHKRRVLQRISEYQKLPEPPISGLDALLVSQVALNQDINAFIADAHALAYELQHRVQTGEAAYKKRGPRILMAGSSSPLGYAKIHYIAESSGLRIVADESCTGSRYFRNLVDESHQDLDGMLKAIADRYFAIDCSCFSPNTERLDNIMKIIDEFQIQGVIHHILQYCHTYNIEARAIERALKKKGIPSLIIETDYSSEDEGQIRTRIEAFAEMIGK